MVMTQPLGRGTLSTGLVVLMGLNVNLDPKDRYESEKKDAE